MQYPLKVLKVLIPKVSLVILHIWKGFSLKEQAPDGIVLLLDDFVLPPNQKLAIISDSDVIRYIYYVILPPHHTSLTSSFFL